MDLALIPPMGYESFMHRSTTQLALAIKPYMKNLNRTGQLRKAAENNHYIILDNGANEAAPAAARTMHEYGQLIGAKEIVLPDVLDSRIRTINAIKVFLRTEPATLRMFPYRMGVIQGKSKVEVLKCIDDLADIQEVNVIGIPRRLIENLSELNARIDLANQIADLFPKRFQVHLLGAHPAWPKEIKFVRKYTSVRSMDTSLPFNWAIAGKKIDELGTGYSRPINYFTAVRDISMSLLNHNISTALGWVRGDTSN